MNITELSVEGFRCFGSVQKARLAPLTLLVGENSAGKTSFLAMVRALQAAAGFGEPPDFNSPPYEFGSYDDMAHRKGARGGGPVSSFSGSVTVARPKRPSRGRTPLEFSATFAKGQAGSPVLIRRRYKDTESEYSFEESDRPSPGNVEIGTPDVRFRAQLERRSLLSPYSLPPRSAMDVVGSSLLSPTATGRLKVLEGDVGKVRGLWKETRKALLSIFSTAEDLAFRGILAGAPVRSRPKRTYEASPGRHRTEGDSVPRRLADSSAEGGKAWKELRELLVSYGKVSGLFDDIRVRRLGRDSDPFQIQVRRFGGDRKGTWRNLTDVGYGVSQALPVLVEIIASRHLELFLLQQPEVHLHPQAQAAIGSFFVTAAAHGRQLLVETHSDHLLDRIRMDIRDAKTDLSSEDVSLLYFERQGLEVRIYSLRIDDEGNVLGAPDSYRRFFLEETERNLGL